MTLFRINQIIATRHRLKDSSLFKTEYTTTTPNEDVIIPIFNETYDFNYRVDGGSWINVTNNTLTITIATAGVHTIDFDPKDGGLSRWDYNADPSADPLQMTKITQWGTNQWKKIAFGFIGCQNLVCTATDRLDLINCTSINRTFNNCNNIGTIKFKNTDNITDFEWSFVSIGGSTVDLIGCNTPNLVNMISSFRFSNGVTILGLEGIDTSNVTNFGATFDTIVNLTADITNLNLSSATSAVNILRGTTIATADYDAFWIKQNTLTLQNGVTFGGGNNTCTPGGAGETARANVIATYSWSVTDGDLP